MEGSAEVAARHLLADNQIRASEQFDRKVQDCSSVQQRCVFGEESDYLDGSYCLGLVRGVLGMNQHIDAFTPLFCIPQPGSKTSQIAKRVAMYATEHPDLLERSETEFVILVFKNTFPCRLGEPDTSG